MASGKILLSLLVVVLLVQVIDGRRGKGKLRCQQPKKIGDCKASIKRWYFDTTDKECKVFFYGGCKGNRNRFMTERACKRRCIGRKGVKKGGKKDGNEEE